MDGTFVSVHPPASHAGAQPHLYGLALPNGPAPCFVPQFTPSIALGPAASARLDPEFALKCTPCRAHFDPRRPPCRFGDACLYSHDPIVYRAARRLRGCPNPGCANLCRGRQCKQCHARMVQRRAKRGGLTPA